jgi:hypothetical protein
MSGSNLSTEKNRHVGLRCVKCTRSDSVFFHEGTSLCAIGPRAAAASFSAEPVDAVAQGLQVVVKGTNPMIEYVSLLPYCWTANLAEALSQSMA